jgi:hypothetical protein
MEGLNMDRYEEMRRNNGEAPKEIDRDRFWYLLEVLPPAKWTRREGSESFMVIECETANLYTWCARIGERYYEMIAPNDCNHYDILNLIAMHLPEEATP